MSTATAALEVFTYRIHFISWLVQQALLCSLSILVLATEKQLSHSSTEIYASFTLSAILLRTTLYLNSSIVLVPHTSLCAASYYHPHQSSWTTFRILSFSLFLSESKDISSRYYASLADFCFLLVCYWLSTKGAWHGLSILTSLRPHIDVILYQSSIRP